MATKSLLRAPEHTLPERFMGYSKVRPVKHIGREVGGDTPGRQALSIVIVQTLLNLIAITLIGLTVGAFIAGNNTIGVGALGPALAGAIGSTGLQVRTIQRCIQRQQS